MLKVEKYLKSFPGAKASQLNHYIKPTLDEHKYDYVIIRVGINGILRNKNDTDMNNLPEIILEIATLPKLQRLQNIHLGFTTIKANQSQYITNQ